jgi:L-cystine transport system substrate-binding protein
MTTLSRDHHRSSRWIPLLFGLIVLVTACQAGQGEPSAEGSEGAGAEGTDVLARVMESGVMRVANPQTSPPYSFRDENDEVQGFDVDLANEIGERMGIEIEFIQGTFDTFIPGLDNDRWDIVIAGMSITPEREEAADFSVPYRVASVTVFLNGDDDTKVTDLEDLAGRSIAVLAGSSDVERAESVPDAELQTYENVTLALTDLGLGRVDSYIGSRPAGLYAAQVSDLNVRATDVELATERNGMAIKQGEDELKAEIDRLVREMLEDGTIAELSQRWFGEDLTERVEAVLEG